MNMSATISIHGARCLGISDADRYVDLLLSGLGKEGAVTIETEPQWAVIQCTDTFVWGIYFSGQWLWPYEADRRIRRASVSTLCEARIFSPDQEILIWREKGRGFRGRIAIDVQIEDDCTAPIEEMWRFEGDRLQTGGDPRFVTYVAAGGNVVVIPSADGVRIRHYLTRCPETGVFRIGLSRFVDLFHSKEDLSDASC